MKASKIGGYSLLIIVPKEYTEKFEIKVGTEFVWKIVNKDLVITKKE